MTPKEARILGYVCFLVGSILGYYDEPWVALAFLLSAGGFLIWVIFREDGVKPTKSE